MRQNPDQNNNNRLIRYSSYLFSGIFHIGLFIFFAFFYNSHFHFAEQFQMHLLTWDYFLNRLSFPGGLAGYIGTFLTQFYYISLAGPLIVVLVLFILSRTTARILSIVNKDPVLFPFTLIPSLLAAMIVCNEFYPLSAIIGFLISVLAALTYLSVSNRNYRAVIGLAAVPLIYWLAGGAFICFLFVVITFEIIISLKCSKEGSADQKLPDVMPVKIWYLVIYVVIGIGIPLLVRRYLIMQPLMISFLSEFYYNIRTTIPTAAIVLFILPAFLMIIASLVKAKAGNRALFFTSGIAFFLLLSYMGIRSFANFNAEEIMKYDYLVRSGRWNDVVKFASRKPPKNYLSLSMLNLSLAKTGQLGNKMFSYPQRGENGLFLPFDKEYVAPMIGGEILYNLGFTNAAQEYTFESMETIPNLGKSVRAIKRLAETNLINGQYKVAEKYLDLLEKTLFYRSWARTTKLYLNNEDKINSDPLWGEKRRFAVTNDYFFSIKNIEASLAMMVKDHPDNGIAFEYLMAFYLINKDLRNFMNLIPVMEKMNYNEVPASYQEAMMYIIGLSNKDPMTNSPSYITQETKSRMKTYADIYTNYRDAETRLKKNFSGTYWYYLHFTELVKSDNGEKK